MRPFRLLIPILALVTAGCATTQDAVIRGSITPPEANARGSNPRTGGSASEAVVYATRAEPAPHVSAHKTATPPPAPPEPVHVVEGPGGFTPQVVAVCPGQAVVFENRDRVFHNAFSVSPVQRFDLGKIAPGATRSMTFTRTGVVRVFCDLHPNAAAWVFVAPTPTIARPSATGVYALPALPPGAYEVRAWHPRWGERQWSVRLPREGLALDLKF